MSIKTGAFKCVSIGLYPSWNPGHPKYKVFFRRALAGKKSSAEELILDILLCSDSGGYLWYAEHVVARTFYTHSNERGGEKRDT